jgi:hypothetical protein
VAVPLTGFVVVQVVLGGMDKVQLAFMVEE